MQNKLKILALLSFSLFIKHPSYIHFLHKIVMKILHSISLKPPPHVNLIKWPKTFLPTLLLDKINTFQLNGACTVSRNFVVHLEIISPDTAINKITNALLPTGLARFCLLFDLCLITETGDVVITPKYESDVRRKSTL